MKVISHDINVGKPCDAHIVPLADLHIGDAQADLKKIQSLIDYVLNTKDTYCILGGDLMDTAIASSIGDTYLATLQPGPQLEAAVKLFGPLAKAGKILAVLPGNHEARISKSVGIDTTALFTAQLGLTDVYTPTTALIYIRVGCKAGKKEPFVYSLYATHGSGGGRRPGGKINRLIDYATIVDADVYVCGHTHMPMIAKQSYYRTVPQRRTVRKVEKTFVNTASALGYGGYGDAQGYAPSSNSYPTIHLNGSEGREQRVIVTV